MIVGVLGGGQLGRMLGLAGIPLGLKFRFLDPDPDAPAAQVGELLCAEYDDLDWIDRVTDGAAVVTFEFENVPAAGMGRIAAGAPVYPPPLALETSQDRLREKQLFTTLGIPTPPYIPLSSPSDLAPALARTGWPAVLKTRRFGYDGKGQWLLRHASTLEAVLPELPTTPESLILEGFVAFDREVSIIVVRGRTGETRFYPLVENHHESGILRLSQAPAPGHGSTLQQSAEEFALRICEALDYVGVMAVEFFVCGESLLANEIAPRVHNSGHWTIEGAETSQFENHLRAVLGLPLGGTAARGRCAMWNILGSPPRPDDILRVPGAHLHLYGKAPRAGRKIGHVTVCGHEATSFTGALDAVRAAAPQS